MVRKMIEQRKLATAGIEKNGSRSNHLDEAISSVDAIDVLLRDVSDRHEADQPLPFDFITGNIIEMMIPGEDSVPMVMTLAVKYLSDNPVALSQLVVSI